MKLKLFVSSVDYFKQEHPHATKVLDINSFIGICRSVPLFTTVSNTKTYYYTASDINKTQLDHLVNSKLPIYIVDENVDKRSSLFKYVKKNKLIITQPTINSAILKKRYPTLSSRSINLLLTHVTDYSKISSVFGLLDSVTVLTDDKVSWLFSGDFEDKIFDSLSYLLVGNVPKFYKLYTDLINLGESKFKFMILLYTLLQTLLVLKPHVTSSVNEIQNKTGLNYYQVKNNTLLAKKHTTGNLRKWFLECGRIERELKYGKADVDIDLELLILDILGKK